MSSKMFLFFCRFLLVCYLVKYTRKIGEFICFAYLALNSEKFAGRRRQSCQGRQWSVSTRFAVAYDGRLAKRRFIESIGGFNRTWSRSFSCEYSICFLRIPRGISSNFTRWFGWWSLISLKVFSYYFDRIHKDYFKSIEPLTLPDLISIYTIF